MTSWLARFTSSVTTLRPSILGFHNRFNPRQVLLALSVVVILLGGVDYLTGPVLSSTSFYLIPTAVGTVFAGRRVGMIVSAESAVVSSISIVANSSDYDIQSVINGFLLLATLGIIVLLIAAVRDNAVAANEAAVRGREFLAFAGHQLRTPLAGIRASTDALLVTGATAQQERLLANISTEADRTGRLMTSLLRMARLDQDEPPTLADQDIAELCAQEIDRLRLRAGALSVRLDASGAPSSPRLVSAEATREALANLLDNARRHARTLVRVTIGTTPSDVEIRVADDGLGLSDDAAARVFEPFVSLDGEGGSGLGLPIARGLVEVQGGRLTYEHGQFVIRLPNRSGPAGRAEQPTRTLR